MSLARNIVCSILIYSAVLLPVAASEAAPVEAKAKTGWVLQIYGSDSSAASLPECLKNLPEAELTNRHLAKVQYRYVRRMFLTVAEYGAVDLKPDDKVEFALEDCESGKLSRVSKVLVQER